MARLLLALYERHPRSYLAIGLFLSIVSLLWRRLMWRTTFIAVTGSVGKTSAKDCLATALASVSPTNSTPGNDNGRSGVARTLLRTRFHHRFAVIEVGARRPGALRRAAWHLDPDIAVILSVAPVHINHFPTLEKVAAEKAQLLSRLGPRGIAILNGDDPRVSAMARTCAGRVVTFGRSAGCDIRATDVSAKWPGGLSLRVHAGAESCAVCTNFVGEHWLPSVLSAIAASTACGVPLREAAKAIERMTAIRGRLEPQPLACGATVLRDDENGSITSLGPALGVMREADAPRRVAVLGDTWDTGLRDPRARFEDLGRRAAGNADVLVFVGDHSHHAVQSAIVSGMPPACCHGFTGLRDAAEFLRSELRSGDLVLMKSQFAVHIGRLYLAQVRSVECWLSQCPRPILCECCDKLGGAPAR